MDLTNMQKLLGVSQEEFNTYSDTYYKRFKSHNTKEYWEFCSDIQEQILRLLQDKFGEHGYALVKTEPPIELNIPKGIYYKVIHTKEAFGINMINKYFSLTAITRDVRLTDMNFDENFPDVCIVSSDYLNLKIKTYVDKVFEDFKNMKPLL